MNITNVQERVMLATLNISVWRARKFDTKATRDVEAKHQATDIGRFNKKLLTANAKAYQKVWTIQSRLRKFFDAHTLDYDQLAVRLLPTSLYMEVADRIRQFQDEFQMAVDEFVLDYPALMQEGMTALNGLGDKSDYPGVAELRTKFGIRMAVLPFPDAAQFHINLPPNVLDGLKAQVDQTVLGAVKTANEDLVGRLYEAVEQFANRLYRSDNVRIDVADKVRELSDLLPKLNFSGDPALSAILEDTRQHLACHSGAALKESAALRKEVADKAMEIEAKMAAFMAGPMPAFGAAQPPSPLADLLM